MGKHQLPNRLGLVALENVIIGELLSIMWKSLVEGEVYVHSTCTRGMTDPG